ncbi:hypothetical protein Tco_1578425 [Tanacetum coccineum]
MTTLAEHIIVAGDENRPPMLEKSMYDSWASRICLFIKGKKHGRMMLDSIDNVYGLSNYLPLDVYALVNHQEAAKDIWDKVKLLMKGIELSYQEQIRQPFKMEESQFNKFKEDRIKVLMAMETEKVLQIKEKLVDSGHGNTTWFKGEVDVSQAQDVGLILDDKSKLGILSKP